MAPIAPSKLDLLSNPKRPSRQNDAPLTSLKSIPKRTSAVQSDKHKAKATGASGSKVRTEEDEDQEDDEIQLHVLSSDEDSSDEDEANGLSDIPGVDVSKLPSLAKDDARVKGRLDRAKKNPSQDRGVLYLSRIPHGFYEDEIKAYFSQFGEVTRVRLSRNKKTGRSKHYGFIEFDSASVAQIVSETMDNYLLMGHILQCKIIPKDEVHPELWVGSNRRWRTVPYDRIYRAKHNRTRTEEQQRRVERKLLKKQAGRQAKIDATGINYKIDAGGYHLSTL